MKTRFLFVLLILPLFTYSQENCKVLLADLDSTYIGECKNGLAHGLGEAWGDFHYIGKFAKGLPHGKGKADYTDGKHYDGAWKKGLKDGKGVLTYIEDNKVVQKTFIWSKGKASKEVLPPPYKVVTKKNITRLRVYSQGGENGVWFSPKSVGGAESENEDIRVTGSNGTETTLNSRIGFENITFPFYGSIRYKAWNQWHTSKSDVFLEIEILEPGNWIVEIQN